MSDVIASLLKNIPRNKTIVFTNGCFDLLHEGHIYLLNEAKKLGDILIVAINDDASVQKLKGNARPIQTLTTRVQQLKNTTIPDFVIPFSADTPLQLIEQIRPDFLVKGGDYDKETIVGNHIAKKTIIIPLLSGFSTTKKIQDNMY